MRICFSSDCSMKQFLHALKEKGLCHKCLKFPSHLIIISLFFFNMPDVAEFEGMKCIITMDIDIEVTVTIQQDIETTLCTAVSPSYSKSKFTLIIVSLKNFIILIFRSYIFQSFFSLFSFYKNNNFVINFSKNNECPTLFWCMGAFIM